MSIDLFDAVTHECAGGPSYITAAWLVSGDPDGEVELWRQRAGEAFSLKIHHGSRLIDGIRDEPQVVSPAPNAFTYTLFARNSDGAEISATVGPLAYWGYCIN